MQFKKPLKLSEIADILACKFIGDSALVVKGINEIHQVQKGDICFVDHPKYYDKCLQSAATVIIIDKEVECPVGKGLIISANPFADFNKLGKKFSPFAKAEQLHSKEAEIGEGTIIQPNVFIGNNVRIGKNCLIYPNVSIYDNTIIGDDVVVHANTVIGSDAFYYKNRGSSREQLWSIGNVVVENGVEIGAGCTIDRGVSGSTIIGRETKIDNQVHIGHDTVIGEMCLFAAQVGIAGCVAIGKNVTLWGQVGVVSGISIGDNAVVLGKSGVGKSLDANKTYVGIPVDEARAKWKELALLRQLPGIIEKLK